MKRTLLSALLAATALVATPGNQAAGASGCRLAGGEIILETSAVRVWRRERGPEAETWGCAQSRGRVWRLDYPPETYASQPRAMMSAGTLLAFAGYVSPDNDGEPPETHVYVADLAGRSGARTVSFARASDASLDAWVVDIALRPSGAVSWTSCPAHGSYPGGPVGRVACRGARAQRVGVFRLLRGQKQATRLDQGRIEATSLRLGGKRRVVWTHAGERRSALLR